mgnify:CR=1 FL=1
MQSGILIGSALLWLAYFVTRVVHFDKACLNIKNFKIKIDGDVLYFKKTYVPPTYYGREFNCNNIDKGPRALQLKQKK